MMPMGETYSSHFGESDAVLWTIERDPVLRSTVVAISLLDRTPDWELLQTKVQRAAASVPILRQRPTDVPFRLGPPRWGAEAVDLDYHLRRLVAPEPGGLRELLDFAQTEAARPLDRRRPLWELTLVEGLPHGSAAFVEKFHHSLTDGLGAIEIATALFDGEPDPELEPMIEVDPEPARGAPGLVVATGVDTVRTGLRMSRSAIRALPRVVRHPVRTTRRGLATTASLARMVAPVTSPRSPLLTSRGKSWRFESFDVPLGSMLDAAHAAGCTLNDAFVAAVAGGLRRYHERHGVDLDDARMTMPISLRHAGDPLGGNRFTPARFLIPLDVADPAERIRRIHALAGAVRDEPALPLTDAVAALLNRLPAPVTTAVMGSMLKGVDLVTTSLTGFRSPMWLAGARVVRQYAFAPPSGAALNVALLSHEHTCCIGLNVDDAAVPDIDVFFACLLEGFAEVLDTAGVGHTVSITEVTPVP